MRPLRSIRSFIDDDDDDADGPLDLVLDAFVAVLYITSSGRLDFTFYRFVSMSSNACLSAVCLDLEYFP